MWVEAITQPEFDLHDSGLRKLPKEETLAGNGNFFRQTPSIGGSVGRQYLTTYFIARQL
jgi:hypothetical protein